LSLDFVVAGANKI